MFCPSGRRNPLAGCLRNPHNIYFHTVLFGTLVHIRCGVSNYLPMLFSVSDGDYSIEKLVMVYNGIMITVFSTGSLTPFLSMFNTANGAATKIFRVIETHPLIQKAYETVTTINKLTGNISFKDVRFSYPARPEVEDQVKNLSCSMEP